MLDSIVLRVAKSAIFGEFDSSYNFDRDAVLKEHPFLNRDGAAFVTLKYDHNLRGCIGSIIAHRKLFDDIVHNALSAAFGDPRFRPLSVDELSHIELEVSVLSEPEILDYDDFDDLVKKVIPKVDGLILKHGVHQGTFLPQVWEQLPTPELFLEHLSLKAGANSSIYTEHPTIYRYRVNAIEKSFDQILSL